MTTTIVTMFFNIKKYSDASSEGRPIEFYLEHGRKTLELPYNMVVFCDSVSRPYLEDIRGDKPTVYVQKDLRDYEYYQQLYPIICKNRETIPTVDKRNVPSQFLVTFFKAIALYLAKSGNFFPSTSHYFWVDMGASHVAREFLNIKIALDNPRPKITTCLIHYRGKNEVYPMTRFLNGHGPCGMGATIFSVETSYIEKFYSGMMSIIYEQISEGVGHNEEQCMIYVYHKHPEWFTLYFGDYYSIVLNYHKTIGDVETVKALVIDRALADNNYEVADMATKSLTWDK